MFLEPLERDEIHEQRVVVPLFVVPVLEPFGDLGAAFDAIAAIPFLRQLIGVGSLAPVRRPDVDIVAGPFFNVLQQIFDYAILAVLAENLRLDVDLLH